MRIKQTPDVEVKYLLRQHLNVNYDGLSENDEVWKKFKDQIIFNATKDEEKRPDGYLKVPFKEALSLVAKRAVFIQKGIAFVPLRELSQIACSHFRWKLSSEMIKAYKYLPNILKDQRLQQMLMALSNHNAIDFNIYEVKPVGDGDRINLADLDYHSRLSFPPCMKTLHQVLK